MTAPTPLRYGDPVYTLQARPGSGASHSQGDPYSDAPNTGISGDRVVARFVEDQIDGIDQGNLQAFQAHLDGTVTAGPKVTLTSLFSWADLAWVDSNTVVIYGWWSDSTTNGLRVELWSVATDLTLTMIDSSVSTAASDYTLDAIGFHPDLGEVLFLKRTLAAGVYTDLHIKRVTVSPTAVGDFPASETVIPMATSTNMSVIPLPLGADTYLMVQNVGSGGGPFYASIYDVTDGTFTETTLTTTGALDVGDKTLTRPRNVALHWEDLPLRKVTFAEDHTITEDLVWADYVSDINAYLDSLGMAAPGEYQVNGSLGPRRVAWTADGRLVLGLDVWAIDLVPNNWYDTSIMVFVVDVFGTREYLLYRSADTILPYTFYLFGMTSFSRLLFQELFMQPAPDPFVARLGRVEQLGAPTEIWGKVKPDSGDKFIKFTADGSWLVPAIEEEDRRTAAGTADLFPMAWDEANQYVYVGAGGSYTLKVVTHDPVANPVISGSFTSDETTNLVSGFIRPGIMPFQIYNSIDAKSQLSILNTSTMAVASTIDLPNAANTSPATIPVTIAKAAPKDGGKVYIFTMTNTGSAGRVWSTDVDASGNAAALVDLGALTVDGGTLSDHFSASDFAMISDRLGIAYNTKTLWDSANPLMFRRIAPMVPADATIDVAYDRFDSSLGGASGHLLNPGCALMARRKADGSLVKVHEVAFAVDGTSLALAKTWTAPITGQVTSMTYTKDHENNVVAVAVINDGTNRRVFYDLFGTPVEVTITGLTWSLLDRVSPANGGFNIDGKSGTTHYWVQHILPRAEQHLDIPSEFILLGPETADQGDSERHRGRFAVDPNTRKVSGRTKMGTTTLNLWAVPIVRFSSIDPGGSTFVDMGQTSFAAVPIEAGPTLKEIVLFGDCPLGSTHYTVSIRMFSDAALTTPLPANAEVYFDSIFVPESGYDLREGPQPYLDGDQDFGIWEGAERNSTSIYGQKPPSNLSQMVILDSELTHYFVPPELPEGT